MFIKINQVDHVTKMLMKHPFVQLLYDNKVVNTHQILMCPKHLRVYVQFEK